MASEVIETGHKYRILKDVANNIWNRISFWTSAADVELSNGKNLETYLNMLETGGGKELTQAQYDALSEEEKMNGTIYYVTDGV